MSRPPFGLSILSLLLFCTASFAQDILPPAPPWKGKSIELIARNDNPWITPAEKSDFKETPSYTETMAWLKKLCESTQNMTLVSIGKSDNYRDINMVIASTDARDKDALRSSSKPLLLIQAGIHSGEIDGKDAGMMLLRDIAFGNKKHLLNKVNLLFIPILSVDGHERVSPYNRVNQRGPSNMGWRTNARNLNLNRDYSKLDTEEIRAVVRVMNEYQPDLYLDLHVTDGADYQYDITYGFSGLYSPATHAWLRDILSPATDKHLKTFGHIPGPLVFSANDLDFRDGMVEYAYSIRFSNSYGDARHVPSILVENHSLKPFRQRVLGTYVFLESVINVLGGYGHELQRAINSDKNARPGDVVLTWARNPKVDSITFLGIESSREKSTVTGGEFISWKARPVTQRIPYIRYDVPDKKTQRPAALWVPSSSKDVIDRLRMHGVVMEVVTAPEDVDVTLYRINQHKFSASPNEGRFTVTGVATPERRRETYFPGSVRIDLNQPLGDLALLLLHPDSPDSFFQWGFFSSIFTRTEYIENYAIEPLAKKMLAADPELAAEFEKKRKEDAAFASDPRAIYTWFYLKSPYADSRWLLYPVGFE